MKYNCKYHFSKLCAKEWCDYPDTFTVKDIAVRFNVIVPKNNKYRKCCLKCIRKINKKLFNEIVNDKKTICLNKI